MVNISVFAALSFLQALQALLLVAVIFSFIPIHAAPFVQTLFPLSLSDVRPEREMMFYRLFVALAVVAQAAWIFVWRRRLDEPGLWRSLIGYAAMTAFWIFVQVFAVFKFILWGAPPWTKVLLYGSMVLAVLSQVFWPEVQRACKAAYAWLAKPTALRYPWAWDIAFLGGLLLLLCPDLTSVLARMFVRDEFYHLDSILMAPGWAHLNGLALDRDVTSEYSLGLPVILSEILKHTAGFDYGQAAALFVGICLAYYAALYLLLKSWLNNRALAACGTLLAVKLQMFHWGVAPLVWQFPSATPLRHWPDMVFFWCLWQHMRTEQAKWFWAAALAAGFALCWVMDVGVYMLAALLVYAAAWAYQQEWTMARAALWMARVVAVPLCAALGLLGILSGGDIIHAAFWRNAFEFAGLFLQGWGALPMTEGLKDKQFFGFCMGFAIPVVYVFTLIYQAALYILKKTQLKDVFVVILCVYGLGSYQYFIHRSGVNSYYVVGIPLVMVVSFWAAQALAALEEGRRRMYAAAAVAVMLGALTTSFWFTYYPNVLNLGGLNWKAEQKLYQDNFDFSKDAALIKERTGAGERVALISSFETRILMQANRPPFFYYFPLMESAHMRTPEVRGTYLHTAGRVAKTLVQLEQEKPAYLFIERKLLAPTTQQSLGTLLGYAAAHYTQEAEGEFLIAMKRKP